MIGRTILAALILSTLPSAAWAAPALDANKLTDQAICSLMTGGVNRANARMPYSQDSVTTATGIAIDCARRIYATHYSVAAPREAAGAAWQERIRAGTTQAVCSGSLTGTMARRGWRFTSTYTFASGEPLTIAVHCGR